MRRSYFQRRSAFFSSGGRVVAAIAIVLLGLIFLVRLALPGVFFAAAAPFFAIGSYFAALNQDPLADETRANQMLINENTALASRVQDLERLVGDSVVPPRGILAGVIARPPMAPYDTLIVQTDAGSAILHGQLVSASGGVPVGTVETVASGRAQIALFSTAGRMTDGWAGEERLPITLQGIGGGAFTVEIPRDALISEGDTVFVPGPGARPVGRVVRIDADPSSPTAILRIEPFVNPFSITTVVVEKTP